jgi:uncharacterized membrane protein YraQ (UPF0718 family)
VNEKTVADFILVFTSILYEAMPFIVLGAIIAGVLEELVPQQFLARVIPRNPFLAIGLSGMLGLVFPMCECGIIPVMRRLLRKGLPLSCCVAYILGGPIINAVVMLSTYYAFRSYEPQVMGGAWMVGLRVGLGYLIACSTALVVEWQYRKHGVKLLAPLAVPPHLAATDDAAALKAKEAGLSLPLAEDDADEAKPEPRRPLMQRLNNISETALHDFVDITVFLILGALLASFMRLLLSHYDYEAFMRSNPAVAIAFMMGLAIALCLCSEADAFVAANIGTVPPAARLAFLVLGPMLDFKLYLMYTRVFRPRLIWTIITCVVIQVFCYTLLTHFLWQNWVVPTFLGGP